MRKTLKTQEFQIRRAIYKVLNEHNFYSPLSKDREIHDNIKFEDKKELYFLVTQGNMEDLKNKMRSIITYLIDKMGQKNKNYIVDYVKRMVGKMLMTYGQKPKDKNDDQYKTSLDEKCWKGYTQKGMKTMFGKKYPNCVKNKK